LVRLRKPSILAAAGGTYVRGNTVASDFVSANGAQAKLEIGAGQDAKDLVEQFERVKAGT
jgi:hypothetical protein